MNESGALLSRLGSVDVLSWNPLRSTSDNAVAGLVNNFGDLIGPLLTELIAGYRAVGGESPPDKGRPVLVAVGSILHFAPPEAVIWGTGVNFKLASKLPRDVPSLDVRAVRGPHTARTISAAGGKAPAVFGDPALLLPRYMPELARWNSRGHGNLVVVPNLNDFSSLSAHAAVNGYAVVDPRNPLRSVLRSIAESGFVVGSSLHAIVIADALGIPARLIRSESEGVFKYRDYLAGTGRPLTVVASNLEDALALGGHELPDVDLDLLLDAFPRDLWTTGMPRHSGAPFSEPVETRDTWREFVQTPHPNEANYGRTFTEQIFPRLIERARQCMDEADPVVLLESSFRYARWFRLSLAAGVSREHVAVADRQFFDAFETDDPGRFARQVWLAREGTHALFRSARRRGGTCVLSIALRPGLVSNSLAGLDLVVECDDKSCHEVSLPVFEMYHREWTVDISAAIDLPSNARIAAVSIRMRSRETGPVEVPVLAAQPQMCSLWNYSSMVGLDPWSEVPLSPVLRSERTA